MGGLNPAAAMAARRAGTVKTFPPTSHTTNQSSLPSYSTVFYNKCSTWTQQFKKKKKGMCVKSKIKIIFISVIQTMELIFV